VVLVEMQALTSAGCSPLSSDEPLEPVRGRAPILTRHIDSRYQEMRNQPWAATAGSRLGRREIIGSAKPGAAAGRFRGAAAWG
jgi:hypothetical protein